MDMKNPTNFEEMINNSDEFLIVLQPIFSELSQNELKCLVFHSLGVKRSVIAQQMNIKPSGVGNYISRIADKLNVCSGDLRVVYNNRLLTGVLTKITSPCNLQTK